MKLLTFGVNEVQYAINIERVQSVENDITVIKIPNCQPGIRGIANVRGEIVPIYNLGIRFGNVRERESYQYILVCVDDKNIALEVDSVENIIEWEASELLAMPHIILGEQNYMTKVGQIEERLIIILEMDRLLLDTEIIEVSKIVEESKKRTSESSREQVCCLK